MQQLFSRDRHSSIPGKFYEREGPPLFVNMPPVSGALAWVQGLMSRMNEPHRCLKVAPQPEPEPPPYPQPYP